MSEAPEPTALYRVFGEADLLLYIGVSKDFGSRWKPALPGACRGVLTRWSGRPDRKHKTRPGRAHEGRGRGECAQPSLLPG